MNPMNPFNEALNLFKYFGETSDPKNNTQNHLGNSTLHLGNRNLKRWSETFLMNFINVTMDHLSDSLTPPTGVSTPSNEASNPMTGTSNSLSEGLSLMNEKTRLFINETVNPEEGTEFNPHAVAKFIIPPIFALIFFVGMVGK